MSEPAMEAWMTPDAAAAYVGVSQKTLQRWADAGRIECRRVGPGAHRRYRVDDLARMKDGDARAVRGVDLDKEIDVSQFKGSGSKPPRRKFGSVKQFVPPDQRVPSWKARAASARADVTVERSHVEREMLQHDKAMALRRDEVEARRLEREAEIEERRQARQFETEERSHAETLAAREAELQHDKALHKLREDAASHVRKRHRALGLAGEHNVSFVPPESVIAKAVAALVKRVTPDTFPRFYVVNLSQAQRAANEIAEEAIAPWLEGESIKAGRDWAEQTAADACKVALIFGVPGADLGEIRKEAAACGRAARKEYEPDTWNDDRAEAFGKEWADDAMSDDGDDDSGDDDE